MLNYKSWLQSRYRPGTVKRYYWELSRWQAWSLGTAKATRSDILDYLDTYRQQGKNMAYVSAILAGLKAYYRWLEETGQRKDHPCRYLKLRDKPPYQLEAHLLFDRAELDSLLERTERYPLHRDRNQVIIGLLIWQGLTLSEMCKLRPADIDLDKAKIHVPATPKTKSRILSLEPQQILPLHRYLSKDRQLLLKKNQHPETKARPELLITSRGTAENGEGIHYLIKSQQKHFPERKLTPERVRMSVIALWLKSGLDLREVQYRAGHKRATSTEKYRQNRLEALQVLIEMYHPLG